METRRLIAHAGQGQMLNQSGLAMVPFGFSAIRVWSRGTSWAATALLERTRSRQHGESALQ